MSKEYPCVYYDREKCTLHGTEPENIDWCVMGPCSKETPSNADHIRSMTDEELADFLVDLADDGNLLIREWLKEPYKEA